MKGLELKWGGRARASQDPITLDESCTSVFRLHVYRNARATRHTLVSLLDASARASGGRGDFLQCLWQNGQQELVPGQRNLSRKGDEPRSKMPASRWTCCHVAQSNDFEPG